MAQHLTLDERDRIAQWHHQGWPQNAIAAEVARSPSCLSRELRRNAAAGRYHAAAAQVRAAQRRSRRPLTRKLDRLETNAAVRHGLARYWSPDQIAGRLKRDFPRRPERHVTPPTIYAWIARQEPDLRRHGRQFLRRRGKRPRRKPGNPAASAAQAAIAGRPAVIERRGRVGDFEGDTVLGPPGTGGLVTLVDRRSRYAILTKTKNKEARRVRRRIQQRLQPLPPEQRRSLTFDHGTEFAESGLLEKRLNLRVYFAQPGCPYQR